MTPGTLYVLSGLPGVGKSTLGQLFAQHSRAMYLRIDTVEHALLDYCSIKAEAQGYQMSYRLAHDNLMLGVSVIADSCNPVQVTRNDWQQVASRIGAAFINIEVTCSDKNEHRRRVEDRWAAGEKNRLPAWADVQQREYHPWQEPVVRIDTSGSSPEQSLQRLLQRLGVDAAS